MTPAAPDPQSITPPSWQHCGHDATSADPVGCRGIRVDDHTACLAHLDEADRVAHLAALSPGTDIDHRGTPFTPELLDQLLAALRDPDSGHPHIGVARFDGATFSGDTWFTKVTFSGNTRFDGATFSGDTWFAEVTFSDNTRFGRAIFSGDTWFTGATFSKVAEFAGVTFFKAAQFDGVTFSGITRFVGVAFSSDAGFAGATFSSDAGFAGATFSSDTRFVETTFSGNTWFAGVTFSGDAQFGMARFEVASRLGPLACGERMVLDGAVFQQPVTLEIAARQVSCARTRWASTTTLHLRYAELDLRDAVFEYPVLVAARPTPFPLIGSTDLLSERELLDLGPGVRLSTVGGVDAAHLALHDVDLSGCRFAGAVHLDQLRVDGWCTFATTPTGWNRRFPWWWSRRNTLTEEHHWRVRAARRPDRATARGWAAPPQDAPELKPAAVAALYRQLRKSLEDGKNEPDAADFYYGECEMRRHDPGRPRGGTRAADRLLGAVRVRAARHPGARLVGGGHGHDDRGDGAVGRASG
ncbi:pentapeptide repeat-containing protein [Streptomyces kanasensis]|uniref:pentapeptide repeat-containing protein n=1 Tax=Streptomyces kanasensis TaxID=936756 RepID=UPI00383016BD